MSAYIVSRRHIDVLVASARLATSGGDPLYWGKKREFPAISETQLGRMLWTENLRSVAARYPDSPDGKRPGPDGFLDADAALYSPTALSPGPSPIEALKAIGCYEYQSCEHKGWKASEAHDFCQELRSRLITLLPGYDKAPWEW